MASDSGRGVAWQRAALVVVVGLATGALTQLGQGLLPEGWSQAANAISPWLFVAFLVGSAMPDARWAAVAGVAVLALALAGYYGMTEIRYGIGGGSRSLIVWGTGAGVGGVVFGVAGRWWRAREHRQRALALGLLAAVAIAEGVYVAVVLSHPAVGAGFAVAGLLVPVILGRGREDRIGAYDATLPMLGLGALGYLALLALDSIGI